MRDQFRSRLGFFGLLILAFTFGGGLFLWLGHKPAPPVVTEANGTAQTRHQAAPPTELPAPEKTSGHGISDNPTALPLPPQPIQPARPKSGARLTVVIDDVGPAHKAGLEVIALPPAVTIAILPYADKAKELAQKAHAAGHEVLVHLPMEPQNLTHNNPGPNALLLSLSADEIAARTGAALQAVPYAIGLNNHMGSAFTANAAALDPVMRVLKQRGLLFLDSRTIATSEALNVALRYGLTAYTRDVFIDDEISPTFIRAQFAKAETRARTKGSAILIGHPHALTLSLLKPWLASLKAKGIELVPLTALPPAK